MTSTTRITEYDGLYERVGRIIEAMEQFCRTFPNGSVISEGISEP